MDVSQKITDISNYYNSHYNCDPNMNEFIELCNEMAKYLRKEAPDYGIHSTTGRTKEQAKELYPIATAVFEKFQILRDEVGKKLLGNDLGITEDSPLYQLFIDSTCCVGTYVTHADIELRKLIGDAALYIAQEKRNVRLGLRSEFHYDDDIKFEKIKKLEKLYPESYGKTFAGGVEIKSSPSLRSILIAEITASYEQTEKVR